MQYWEELAYSTNNSHKKIVILAGHKYTKTAQNRYSGWEKAMEENNLFNKNLVFWGEFSIDFCYQMMKEVFKNLGKVDSVFTCNALIALGAIQAIEENNYKIPNDISIVGFDDIYLSKFLKPPLTTVRQSIYEMCRIAAQLLLDRMENNKKFSPKKIVVEGKLIVRSSVAQKN